MRHAELHILSTETDAYFAEIAGLITFKQEEFCENCDRRVAFDDDGEFIQCAIFLTDSHQDEILYLLCIPCLQPVLHPGRS
jgi:hypothetical protein